MRRTVEMVFDGEVLRPQTPLDLEPNRTYQVTIDDLAAHGDDIETEPGILDDILALAGDYGLPEDFAAQLDHYLYGTPKR